MSATSELTGRENVCDILNLATNVIKIDTSDNLGTFVGLLIDLNTSYEGKAVNRVFVKLYLDIDYYKRAVIYQDTAIGLAGVKYETSIYELIAKNGVMYPDSFLKYYAGGGSCPFETINASLMKLGYDDGKIIYDDLYYSTTLDPDSTTPIALIDQDHLKLNKKTYQVTSSIMEAMSPKSFGILDFYINIVSDGSYQDKLNYDRYMMSIITQVLFGCIAMEDAKIAHNDLHAGNVNIEELPEPIDLTYELNGVTYFLRTKYKAKIFDFDRGYSEFLGDNRHLTDSLEPYGITNEVVPARDFVKFYVNILPLIPRLIRTVSDSTVSDDFMDAIRQMPVVNPDNIYHNWMYDIVMSKNTYVKQMILFKKDFSEEVRTTLPVIKDLPEDYVGRYPNEFYANFKPLTEMVPFFVELSNAQAIRKR